MKNKSSRARMQMIFGSLLFALALIAEMYLMTNYPNQYIAIAVIAVLALMCVYLVVDGFLVMQKESEARRNEQNEYIYKSEKAAFLVSKKNFESLGERLDQLEQSLKLPAEEIINAQKGFAKVSINRSRENAEALMNSNDMLLEQMKSVSGRLDELAQATQESRNAIDKNRETVSAAVNAGHEAVSAAVNAGHEAISAAVSAGREALLESQEKIRELNEKALQVREQELIVNMKDMELRLNNAIMQIQQTPVMASPMPAAMAASSPEAPTKELPLQEPMPAAEPAVTSTMEEMSAFDEEFVKVEEASGLDEAFAEAEETLTKLMEELPETKIDAAELPQQGTVLDDAVSEMAVETEPELSVEPELMMDSELTLDPDLSFESETASEPELSLDPDLSFDSEPELSLDPDLSFDSELSLDPDLSFESELASEPELSLDPDLSFDSDLTLEPELSVEPEVAIEPESKELPPMPDLSDPNKPLSLDEIDALFANMGLETTEAAEDPVVPEPMIEPDLIIGSDLIEGLDSISEPELASELEPVAEPEPIAEPELASASEPIVEPELASELEPIAEPEPVPQAEAIPEPAPAMEPIVVEAVKPDMPDLSDPNKALSADEIAALFANLA